MEVILREDIENVGYANDIVVVKAGFGRNCLIPQKKAILATVSARKVLAENLKQRSHKLTKEKDAAQKMADAISKTTIKVGAKVGENGKIFGSVNTIQIADALKAAGHAIERKAINMKGDAIKQIGTYEATVRVHKEIEVNINFEVIEE
ncbi:MAG: large subunit ribosomal protein L9 [Flavobacteriales bacterium]|jgi:large subunit ribosomal protein L9